MLIRVQTVRGKNMRIGSVILDNITILAPLAGFTHPPFRILAKEAGCALVCSEMISANALVFKPEKTKPRLVSSPEEKPISVQIFGADPAIMAEAATKVEASGADIIDINFGCSVKKVIKTGAGVALMREPEKAEAVIKAVRRSVALPLTIKIRTGWDKSGDQAFTMAKMAEAYGVNAITVHPRTAAQGFRDTPDWSNIAAIKKKVSIPVIGNGDIKQPEDALKMRNSTDCDAVMIGRAALGNPWIFTQVIALIEGKEVLPPDLALRFEGMIRYLKASVQFFGEKHASHMMRGRLGWFVKGLPCSSNFRESIKRISSEDEAMKFIIAYKDFLQSVVPGGPVNLRRQP